MKIVHKAPFSLSIGLFFIVAMMAAVAVSAQETRSTLLGTVRDSAGAVVTGADVTITNTETNTVINLKTNSSGYFEAGYLLPGTYSLSVSAPGFKKVIQEGIVLPVNSRTNIDTTLEIGTTSELVTVTAMAQLLETTSGSGSSALEQRQVMDLPVFGNSAILIARSVPGVQWTGQPNYLGPHSNVGASAVSAAGGVGGTEFSLDGVPNLGGGRRVGYLPFTDTISEMKIETAPFDASKGHSSGASISMISKSGTNDYHGTLTWQHWQQRLNATQSTTNAGYWGRIKGARTPELAEELSAEERQFPGHSNSWAGVIGGPVRIPKLYDGRDRLFFFFSYNGTKDAKSEEPTAVNRTVPTEAQRRGDFSDLLRIDPNRYQIYDPRTAQEVTGGVCGNDARGRPRTCVVRQPFPNNQVPILNPLYRFYEQLYPLPNDVPGVVSREGRNNYLAPATEFSWDYTAFSNRIDLQLSPKQRMFGRWSYNDFLEDRGDWVYETARGLLVNGQVRKNIGITFDHVYTFNSTTIFNWSVAWNRFIEGSVSNDVQTGIPPSAVGLPAYLDEKAGQYIHLPTIRFSDNSYSDFDRGYPGFTRYSVGTVRGELSKYVGTHSLRFGVDLRENWRAAFSPGQTSSEYTFNNSYVRRTDNTTNAGELGLEWAAFMLGVPNAVSVSTNDSLYLTNKYYAGYIQDDWKVNGRLTLNFGLRYELEGGFKERFNRGSAGFDPTAELPISAAAEAAYAANPLAERPAGDFIVRGGSLLLGKDGAPDTANDAKGGWMPRVGFAFKINDKTVLRGGYGIFYDTINVLNEGLDASGFSRGTGTTITDDRGLTFNHTNLTSPECLADISQCRPIFADPFPVRADGTRFVTPPGNEFGLMTEVGRAFDFVDRNWERARQQRWRLGIQREIGKNMVAEAAYLGSYADRMVVTRRLDFLPEQYWASGLIRNNLLADDLNSSVPNPFHISNFAFLQTSDPKLYQDLSTNGFFTGKTRNRHSLLRAFPHMSTGDGLRNTRVPDGKSKYNHLEASITRRMSRGYSFTLGYTWASNFAKTTRENEFDEELVWTPSNNSTPHHLMANFIYELPFGKGKRFLSGNNRWLGAIFGGWQVSGIYHLQSGRVIGLGNWFYYGGDLRDIALSPDERSTDAWFNWRLFPGASRDYSSSNRAAYETRIRSIVPESVIEQMGNICGSADNQRCTYSNVTPTDFQPNSFHRRIFPTSLNWLRGDRMSQLDANIIRRVGITEKKSLEFRVDFINALNSVQWDLPNTDINSSNFGKLTTQWNTPRWIQFQLRLAF